MLPPESQRKAALQKFAQRNGHKRMNPPDPGWLPNNPQSIKQFQRFHGLVPDGIVGPKTAAKMRQLRTTLSRDRPPGVDHGGIAGGDVPQPWQVRRRGEARLS